MAVPPESAHRIRIPCHEADFPEPSLPEERVERRRPERTIALRTFSPEALCREDKPSEPHNREAGAEAGIFEAVRVRKTITSDREGAVGAILPHLR